MIQIVVAAVDAVVVVVVSFAGVVADVCCVGDGVGTVVGDDDY